MNHRPQIDDMIPSYEELRLRARLSLGKVMPTDLILGNFDDLAKLIELVKQDGKFPKEIGLALESCMFALKHYSENPN